MKSANCYIVLLCFTALFLTSCANKPAKAQAVELKEVAAVKEIPAPASKPAEPTTPYEDKHPNEPSIAELQRAAIRYAEVNPDKIINWRKQAAMKALMPEVNVGYDTNIGNSVNAYNYGGKTTYTIGPDDASSGWDFSAKWDLGDLVYNDDQTSIDSRSKLMVQLRNDILDKLNPAYFERKKLQRDLDRIPDKSSQAYAERDLRIEELTATIDGLTGGYLSNRTVK